MSTHGIHHVTAIAGAAGRNADFYTRVLGLRLVKKTVNFDDPGTYHLYYGDEAGQPGTIITFFPWDHVAAGRVGVGETQQTVFRVPEEALGFWIHRFVANGVEHEPVTRHLGESVITFRDPDGMRLGLAGIPGIASEPTWSEGDVPPEAAIRGVHSVNLLLAETAGTAAVLTDVLGFVEAGREGSVRRFRADGTGIGGIVDLHEAGGFLAGRAGGGSVHHIAFRAKDDAEQDAMVKRLRERHGLRATEQKDRAYFRSVYFREPGGVLFEIATDEPGFDADESRDRLGRDLKLPAFLEGRRPAIEAALPPIG
jgi:glyoxalase family protein